MRQVPLYDTTVGQPSGYRNVLQDISLVLQLTEVPLLL